MSDEHNEEGAERVETTETHTHTETEVREPVETSEEDGGEEEGAEEEGVDEEEAEVQ